MRDNAEETYALEAEFPALSEGADFLPRLWASRKIGHLLKRIILEGESEELVEQIVELGTRYGIATPYTSFLVEEAAPPPPATVQLVPAPPLALRAVPLAKSTQQLAAAEAPEISEGVKEVAGRVFLFVDGVWQESTYEEGTETLDIQYLSDAYFQLLSESPELGPILALGEEVIFRLGERFVHVGSTGLTELSPELIAELKGA